MLLYSANINISDDLSIPLEFELYCDNQCVEIINAYEIIDGDRFQVELDDIEPEVLDEVERKAYKRYCL
jgi:hypothetical protein